MRFSDFTNPIQRELRQHFQLASDKEIIQSLNLQFRCKDRIDNHALFLGALEQEMASRGWDYSVFHQLKRQEDATYQIRLINNRLEIAS